jgi:hypothetical protein
MAAVQPDPFQPACHLEDTELIRRRAAGHAVGDVEEQRAQHLAADIATHPIAAAPLLIPRSRRWVRNVSLAHSFRSTGVE